MSNSAISTLEHFSPELFYQIFRFLNGYDAYKAFYGLNDRLTKLLIIHAMKYIDLSEISLYESRRMLADVDCSQVNTLKLSDKYDSGQIEQLLSPDQFPLDMFPRLRTLRLTRVGLFTCHSLARHCFASLSLQLLVVGFRADLCGEKLVDTYRIILDNICVQLRSLTELRIYIDGDDEMVFTKRNIFSKRVSSSTTISTSLERLTTYDLQINDIENTLARFPALCELRASVKLNRRIVDYPLMSKLTHCKFGIILSQFVSLVHLLKQCPNLQQLELVWELADEDGLDGEQWESLITMHLSKLKQFDALISTLIRMGDPIKDSIAVSFAQREFWQERKTTIEIREDPPNEQDLTKIEITVKFAV